jgi:sarcosine oxidase subunit beta
MRYSGFRVIAEALTGHKGWKPVWRDPAPKAEYDYIIVGGGGHGLATAYYLAKEFRQARIAVLEKGYLGGGNVGRNTTIIRSNYLLDGNEPFYEFSLKLWEGLEQDLNYNAMVSQRGILNLIHTDAQRDAFTRRGNAMILNGADAELLDREQIRAMYPWLNFDNARFPIKGGLAQRRGGTVRHDAVAWGYARAASAMGVDILQQCEVQSFVIEGGRCRGVVTSRGTIRADRVGMAVAGHSSQMAEKAGFRLPVTSYALQACVSEPVKPVLDTVVLSPGAGTYASQSDKGEMVVGGGLDRIPSYGQRGNLPVLETVLSGLVEMFPAFRQLKLMRQWAGIVDIVPDSSPIIGESPLPGLFLNCGWGTGGFKSIPAGGVLLAHLLATGQHHDISRPFDLDRFARGRLIDEAAGSGIAH